MMNALLGPGIKYFTSNTICKTSSNVQDEDILYPTKFLNSLKFSRVLNHVLKLKEGFWSCYFET